MAALDISVVSAPNPHMCIACVNGCGCGCVYVGWARKRAWLMAAHNAHACAHLRMLVCECVWKMCACSSGWVAMGMFVSWELHSSRSMSVPHLFGSVVFAWWVCAQPSVGLLLHGHGMAVLAMKQHWFKNLIAKKHIH